MNESVLQKFNELDVTNRQHEYPAESIAESEQEGRCCATAAILANSAVATDAKKADESIPVSIASASDEKDQRETAEMKPCSSDDAATLTTNIPNALLSKIGTFMYLGTQLDTLGKAYQSSKAAIEDHEEAVQDIKQQIETIVSWLHSYPPKPTSRTATAAYRMERRQLQITTFSDQLQEIQAYEEMLDTQLSALEASHKALAHTFETLHNEILSDLKPIFNIDSTFHTVQTCLSSLTTNPIITNAMLNTHIDSLNKFQAQNPILTSLPVSPCITCPRDPYGYPLYLQPLWPTRLRAVQYYRAKHKAAFESYNLLKDAMPRDLSLAEKLGQSKDLRGQGHLVVRNHGVLMRAIELARKAGLICDNDGVVVCNGEDGLIEPETYDCKRARKWIFDREGEEGELELDEISEGVDEEEEGEEEGEVESPLGTKQVADY